MGRAMNASKRTLHANDAKPKVLATLASTTVAFALSRGMTLDAIEAATGVAGLDLVDPEARLPDDVMTNLWRALTPSRPGMALSLEMARAAPFSFFGGLAHGIQFADTLRTALGFLKQNSRLLADRVTVEFIEDEALSEAHFVISHPLDATDGGRTAEVGIALGARLVNEILEVTDGLCRVEFAHGPVGTEEAYQNFFRTPVLFHCAVNKLVFTLRSLDTQVSQANCELFSYVELYYEKARQRLAQDGYPAEFLKLREAVVGNASRGDFGAASAAAHAGLSLRSAQRLATAHGTSLQGLIDDVRMQSAMEFLNDPDINIHTVALLVGYSDDRAFRRAFKRWTGQTPSSYRRSAADSRKG